MPGSSVTLLERRPHLGGSNHVHRDEMVTPLTTDSTCFSAVAVRIRICCSDLGATDKVHLQSRLDVPVLAPGGRRGSIRRSNLPAPFHLAASLARYRLLSVRERLWLFRPVLALSRLKLGDPVLDDINFGDWLRQRGQSAQAIARLWNLIIQPTLNVSVDDASLAIAAQVFQVGFLRSANGADMGWATGAAHHLARRVRGSRS